MRHGIGGEVALLLAILAFFLNDQFQATAKLMPKVVIALAGTVMVLPGPPGKCVRKSCPGWIV
jgi:hypothetical protein